MSYQIVIFAYLCHRDAIAINAGGSGNIAEATLTQLKSLKKSVHNQIGVWFVSDNPRVNAGVVRSRFATLDNGGNEVVDSTVVPADNSVAAVMQKFLEWTAEKTDHIDVPSFFLFSGHGTPGFGLGVASPGRAELLEVASRPELQRLLADFDMEIVQGNKRSLSDQHMAGYRLQEQLPLGDSYELLRSLKEEVFLDLLAVLNRVRTCPRYMEVGLNLMSSGTDPSSVLSVRRFKRLIEQTRQGKPFDAMMFQACSLGLIDVVYELRNSCKTLIVSTTFFTGDPSIERGIKSALEEMHRGVAFEHVTPYSIIQSYMYDRFYSPVASVGFISSVPFGTELQAWRNFNDGCRTLFTYLKNELNRGGRNAFNRLAKIRNALPRCKDIGRCEKIIYDLNEFVSAVAIEFPDCLLQNSELVRGIVRNHSKLIRYRHATPESAFSCCANGMALYFPRTKAELFESYTSGSDDGFDWLSETGWRELLDAYLGNSTV